MIARPYVHPRLVVNAITAKDLAGAKVLFVNMPLRESAVPNCVPTGVALLAARLQEYDVEVHIVDLNAYRIFDGTRRRVLTFDEAEMLLREAVLVWGQPTVVAISGIITTLRWQQEIVRRMRTAVTPDAFIVSGNGLATEFREGLFNWIPELDAVAHSEGDYSILKIVFDALLIRRTGFERALVSAKLNPYYLGEAAGRQRFLYDGGRIANLDDLPVPAYDLLTRDPYGANVLEVYLRNEIWGLDANNSSATPFSMKRSLNMVSSRGCPFGCNFCFRKATGERHYSVRSAERFAEELRSYHDSYGVDFIGVLDDNFMVSRERIEHMVPILKPFIEQTGLRWGTHGRLDEAADLKPSGGGNWTPMLPKRVDQMAEAGCVYIGFGAESANEKTLTDMGKGGFILANGFVEENGERFPRTMVEGIKNTKFAGIHANCTWIMGYPSETLQNLKTSVAFMQWQKDFYKAFGDQAVNERMFVCTAYPGTTMFKHPRVRELLGKKFDIRFGEDGEPICDDALRDYVLELDDATKVLHDKSGRPLNFSDMPDDVFLEAQSYVEAGQTSKILEMNNRVMEERSHD